MKNHHEISGVIINIILALVILAFIVIGLNKIGIYRLPEGIEKLLGVSHDSSSSDAESDVSADHELLSFDIKEVNTTVGNLTYENAEKLIQMIDYNDNYSHSIVISNYVDDREYKESVSLECIDGLFSASLFNSDGVVVRQIKERTDGVDITTYDNGVATAVSLPKGGFDISDECGFVITAKEFLDSNSNLQEADFYVFECEYGSAISVVFINVVDTYTVEEKYEISLDYGVILSVESSIDGKIVYSMSTESLENIA